MTRKQIQAVLATTLFLCVTITARMVAQDRIAKGTLRGVVRHDKTLEPMVGVRVSLFSAAPNVIPSPRENLVPQASVDTDSNGEFVLNNIDPGPYRFTAGRNGYVRYESRLNLTTGENKQELVRMVPTATVSGRVQGTTGRAIAGVTVSLFRRTYGANGTVVFSTGETTKTNDLGEYRLYWVTPGRYYVSVTGRSGGLGLGDERYEFEDSVRRGNNEVIGSYTQTFFPGVADVTRATAIDAREGADVRGIDFTLTPERFLSIRGRLVDASTGLQPPKASLSIGRRGLTGSVGWSGPRNYNSATGTFEFRDLPPGQYTISAQTEDRGSLALNGPAIGAPSASIALTLSNSDIDGIVLTVAVPPIISGMVRIDSQLPPTASLDRLRVTLTSLRSGSLASSGTSSSALVVTDATFKLNAISEGEFRVTISGLPSGFYLKEARFNNADVLKTPSRFSTAGSLELVVGTTVAKIEGRVLDEQSRPVPAVETVLIPSDFRDRPELYRRAVTNPAGSFTFTGTTPGNYKVFAWKSLESNSFFDPQVLSRFEEKGIPVRVTESSAQTFDVRIILEASEP